MQSKEVIKLRQEKPATYSYFNQEDFKVSGGSNKQLLNQLFFHLFISNNWLILVNKGLKVIPKPCLVGKKNKKEKKKRKKQYQEN